MVNFLIGCYFFKKINIFIEMQKIGIMTLKIGLGIITQDLINLYITKLAQMISIDSNRLYIDDLIKIIFLYYFE